MKASVALFTLLLAGSALADQTAKLGNKTVLLATFRETKTEKSLCLVRPSNPQATLERYDVKMVKWSGNEHIIPLVGAIIRESERLYGKTFTPFNHIAIELDSSYRILGQQVYDPQLRRAKVIVAEDQNLALVAHEMGHIIGNTGKPGGGIWYQAYNAAVSSPCHHTWYSNSGWDKGRRNEEFAEVYAAYLTHPELLKNGSASCRQAYDFMRKRLFPNADPACLPKPAPAIPLPRPRPTEAPSTTPAAPQTPATTPATVAPTTPATPAPPSVTPAPVKPAAPATPTAPTVKPVEATPIPAKPAAVNPAPVKLTEPLRPAVTPLPQPKPVIPAAPVVAKPVEPVKPAAPTVKPAEAATPAVIPLPRPRPTIPAIPKPQPAPVIVPDRTAPQ